MVELSKLIIIKKMCMAMRYFKPWILEASKPALFTTEDKHNFKIEVLCLAYLVRIPWHQIFRLYPILTKVLSLLKPWIKGPSQMVEAKWRINKIIIIRTTNINSNHKIFKLRKSSWNKLLLNNNLRKNNNRSNKWSEPTLIWGRAKKIKERVANRCSALSKAPWFPLVKFPVRLLWARSISQFMVETLKCLLLATVVKNKKERLN